MAQTVQSLFGLTPEQIQTQRAAEVDARALQYAQMDPFQRANYGIFRGASQLGDVLAQRLGYVDPLVKQAEERKGLLSGMNITDPNSLREAAQKAWQVGQFDVARNLINQANEMDKSAAEAAKARAEAAAKGREALTNEAKNAQGYADTIATRGTPEWMQAYSERLKYLTDKTGSVKEIGVAAGTRAPVYYDQNQDMQYIMQADPVTGKQVRVPYSGGVDRSTSSVSVNASRMEESEFSKQLGKVQAGRLGDAYDKRDAAKRELITFQQLATLPDNQLISGTGADTRIEFGNALVTLGLASPQDAQRVASSQEFKKLSNDLVLARVKQLGYNPSDADRKFIEQTIPSLGTSPQARRALVRFMAKVAKDVADEVDSMEQYATTNRTLTGYKPKMPQVTFKAAPASVADMSDEELMNALQQRQRK